MSFPKGGPKSLLEAGVVVGGADMEPCNRAYSTRFTVKVCSPPAEGTLFGLDKKEGDAPPRTFSPSLISLTGREAGRDRSLPSALSLIDVAMERR